MRRRWRAALAHPEVSGTSHLCLMRPRSTARPRCACDPALPLGPRAQETVWGQARRSETWGDHDREWTAGDDAGQFSTAFKSESPNSNYRATRNPLDIQSLWAGRLHVDPFHRSNRRLPGDRTREASRASGTLLDLREPASIQVQIGNSVPPPLARAIADSLTRQIDGTPQGSTAPLQPDAALRVAESFEALAAIFPRPNTKDAGPLNRLRLLEQILRGTLKSIHDRRAESSPGTRDQKL